MHLTLMESAAWSGHYQWLELRLYEVMGAWVRVVPEPVVKERLVVHARHHAWHAELWHDRLPVLRGVDRDALVVPPDEAFAAFVDAVAAPAEPDQTLEKLVGLYRVALPALVAAYERHLSLASAVSDAPVIRSLRLALRDEIDQRDEGEALIAELLSGPNGAESADRCRRHQERLESELARSRGISCGSEAFEA